MKKILFSVLAALLLPVAAMAATSWTVDASGAAPGTIKVWTSSSSALVSETAVLDVDRCSEIQLVVDSTVAVTPTVTVNRRPGGISESVLVASLVPATGSSTILSGVDGIMVSTANATTATTVNYEIQEYRYKNCRTRDNM